MDMGGAAKKKASFQRGYIKAGFSVNSAFRDGGWPNQDECCYTTRTGQPASVVRSGNCEFFQKPNSISAAESIIIW